MFFRLAYFALVHQNSAQQSLRFGHIGIQRDGIAYVGIGVGAHLQRQNTAKMIFSFGFRHWGRLCIFVKVQFVVQLVGDVMIGALLYIILQFLLHGLIIHLKRIAETFVHR